jgi:hypothetical protein
MDGRALHARPVLGELGEGGDRGFGFVGALELDVEPLAADLVLQLVRGAGGDHLAVVDHHDAVGEAVGLVEVLGGEQHRGAGQHARLDRLPHADAGARVEPGSRLVQEQHRRAGDERGREVEPPAHAARVRLGRALGGVGELEALEQLIGARARLGLAEVVQPSDHLQVLEAGQVLVHGRVLARKADMGAQRRGLSHDVEAGDAGAAPVGLEQRGQDADRGGLAGTVGAQQAEDAAGPRGEVHAAQGADRAVGLLQPLDDDRMIAHAPRR